MHNYIYLNQVRTTTVHPGILSRPPVVVDGAGGRAGGMQAG